MKLAGKITLWTAGALGLACTLAIDASASSISVVPDKSVIWQIVNFLVLIWVLNLVLYRPIRTVISQRKEKVDSLDQSIGQFEQDASDKAEACENGLKAAKSDGLKEKESLIGEATAEEEQIVAAINQKAQQTINENKAKIAKDVQSAAQALQAEVDLFATEISRKILGRDVS